MTSELFAITVYGMLAVLAVRSRARWPLRWPLAIPLVALAACIGAARVYLLDHFLSDVLGSVVLGVTWIVVPASAKPAKLVVATVVEAFTLV